MSDSVRPMALLRVGGWVFLFLLLLIATGWSQYYNVLYMKQGPGTSNFGSSVADMGDVDGDGKSDFIVGLPRDSNTAYIYSGATGSLIRRVAGSGNVSEFGSSVAFIGDISNSPDGRSEYIIGAPGSYQNYKDNAGAAFVYSGLDGSLLFAYYGDPDQAFKGERMGTSVAGAGDVNGDGYPDFIIGSPSWDNSFQIPPRQGRATVYSGLTGQSLATFYGSSAGDSLGFSVNSAGDVDGDGWSDVIIGAPRANPGSPPMPDAGSVYIWSDSGQSWHLRYQRNGLAAGDNLGYSVASVGNVYGDSKSEVIIGAPYAGDYDEGLAYIFSPPNGGYPWWRIGRFSGDNFGSSVAGRGDVNGGGKPDWIVSSIGADDTSGMDVGRVDIFAAEASILCSECNPIFTKFGPCGYAKFGYSVCITDDITGNGKSGFIIGKPGTCTTPAAFVYVNCPKIKGDMNGDGIFSPADVVCLQYCVFLGSSGCGCDRCYADMNCDGHLSAADFAILLNLVYLGTLPPC